MVLASLLLRQASYKICRLLVKFFLPKKDWKIWKIVTKLTEIEGEKKKSKNTSKNNRQFLKSQETRAGMCIRHELLILAAAPAAGLTAPRKRKLLRLLCRLWDQAMLLCIPAWRIGKGWVIAFPSLAIKCFPVSRTLTSPALLLSPCIAGNLCSAYDLITCFPFRKLHCSRLMESPEVFPQHHREPTRSKEKQALEPYLLRNNVGMV